MASILNRVERARVELVNDGRPIMFVALARALASHARSVVTETRTYEP